MEGYLKLSDEGILCFSTDEPNELMGSIPSFRDMHVGFTSDIAPIIRDKNKRTRLEIKR